ncbi:hypothetical protein QYM36_017622 [Artemia franciscana]|uniref:CCHC-type domain-containing protein n=1 Tax=Artemia franciscana TaxID=6661 RepID=A0AA88HAS7_ARTSF|nr:hypothetical protein QYM36_017622 [Artemia franciscana]
MVHLMWILIAEVYYRAFISIEGEEPCISPSLNNVKVLLYGWQQDKIRERQLSEGAGLTLACAIATCRAAEATQAQLMIMSNQKHSKVHVKQEIDVVTRQGRKCYKCDGSFTPGHVCSPKDSGEGPKCYNCGGVFSKSHQCPAKGKSCIKCKKMNHFAKMCRRSQGNIHSIETEESSTDTSSQYFIESIQTMEEKNNEPVAKLYLTKEGINMEFKIDTGAEANVVPMKTLNKMHPQPKLRPTSDILTSYTGESLKVAGICQLEVQYKNREPQTHKFYVVDTDKRPILSRQTSVSLNLIKFIYNIEQTSTTDEILAEYKDVFKSIGKIPGKCKIHLKPGAIPSVQPPRKVPLAIQDKLKNELKKRKTLGNPGQTEKRTGTTAQDEYQHWMEEAFEGLGLGLIVDDIAGVGISKEDHNMQLKAVLQRGREKGVKFNQDKCVFNATAIPYFGHLLTMEGVKPDPNKTKAIAEMPEPRNKEELQTLLGMFNYLSRYIPNLSSLNQPLQELGKAKDFVWTKKHSNACQTICKSLCEHLSYFDTHCQEVEIIVNASQHGLGAQLLVKDETVACGSRSLSDTE